MARCFPVFRKVQTVVFWCNFHARSMQIGFEKNPGRSSTKIIAASITMVILIEKVYENWTPKVNKQMYKYWAILFTKKRSVYRVILSVYSSRIMKAFHVKLQACFVLHAYFNFVFLISCHQ